MEVVQFKLGSFVTLNGSLNHIGMGKIIAHQGNQATVEFFLSISNRRTKTVQASEIQSVAKVATQTRCYVQDGNDQWRMGRIGRKVDNEYEVFFPKGEAKYLPEMQLFVRCLIPIDDPTETLIYKGHETPYFHDRRFSLIQSFVRQRALGRGMSGLLSSRIDLLPHQVEVVRRVLEDPIQRYLLADEVGLGKTVEAGVVLRQYLLDNRTGIAVVIVPPLLIDQWSEELEEKFQVCRFPGRVVVVGHKEIDAVGAIDGVGLVIIDEAHHIAALAASDSAGDKGRFAAFERLCTSVGSLLLLSATPVLSNERDFLAMLHLLDPNLYPLNDVDGFRARVRNRQEVGKLLLSLQEGSPSFAVKSAIRRLRDYFPADAPLARLCDDLQQAVDLTPPDGSARDCAIRSVRVHISETYRLHRRMLRNRRGGVEVAALAGRAAGDGDTPRTLEYDLDERAPRLHELLEEWRDTAAMSVSAGVAIEEDLIRVFRVLYLAAGTWPEALRAVVEARLRPENITSAAAEFAGPDLTHLRDTRLFPGERDVLEGILSILRSPAEDGDRIDLLRQSLEYSREVPRGGRLAPKCVVFTSHSLVCREILRQLRSAFGEGVVAGYHSGMSRPEVEAALTRFRTDSNCFVLVCDRAGEEGRNLQFAERIVHFDLPLDLNRMEQRIGRLDRIGRRMPVKSTIFVGPVVEYSLFGAWYKLLDQGFRVFDRSIASLQFFVEEQLSSLNQVLFRQGASGLIANIQKIRAGITEEQQRLSEQDALDAVDAFEQSAVACFDSISTLENDYAGMESTVHGWVGDALLFDRDADIYYIKKLVHYRPDFDRYKELRTLVPSDWIKQRFNPHLKVPGAFERSVALRIPGTPVLRIGEGFIDETYRYLCWDDRGQAFALWRQELTWSSAEGAEWVGFRFNYVVSTDLGASKEILKNRGLQDSSARAIARRADALFPPLVEVVYLDTDGVPPNDPNLLSILERPYLARDKGGTDHNLANKRLEAIDEAVPGNLWESACRTAREQSVAEALNRGNPALRDRCDTLAAQAERELSTRLAQLRIRAAGRSEIGGTFSLDDLDTEEALNASLVRGIRSPELRLDSVGFIVVSGRPPRFGGTP
jgi:ATP-dependent helicase HepA